MKHLLLFILTCSVSQTIRAQLPQLNLVQVASGFTSPVDIKNCDDNRIFIVDQNGYIFIMDKQGTVNPTPFLDIHTEVNSSGNEQGLLTVAFGPTYKQDGYFYVNYITGAGAGNTRISRFQVSAADSNVADANTEKVILTFVQPFTNHNGSTLLFGADGYLYDTQGDGGDAGDPYKNGQDTSVYLAKILRLDVSNHDTTYVIPPSNPFYNDGAAKGEIWAYGVRNPWRCSFDRLTHDLWIGDVGQNLYEEVDFQPAASTGGQNYGWNCYEGTFPYNTTGCASSGFTWPIFEYGHSTANGCAVIGGYVYRGALFSKLWGLYLCTDNCSGRFWSINQTGPGVFINDTLQSFLTNEYTSFGEDNEGEMYVVARSPGIVYHITETTDCNPEAFISLKDSLTSCASVTLNALFNDSLKYQWFNSNGEISGEVSNQLVVQTPGWYKVQVSKSQVGCQSISDSVFVMPYDTAVLTIVNSGLTYCLPHDTVQLANNISPSGGLFSGMGITGSNFVPDSADIGNNTIIYQYSNLQGCLSSNSFIAQVSLPTALTEAITTAQYCNNNTSVPLSGFVTPTGGTYTGNGVVSDTFNAFSAGIGPDTINYTLTNLSGCTSADTFVLTVSVCTGITDVSSALQFDIFPNPNNGNFKIRLTGNTGNAVTIIISDLLGREYSRQELSTVNGNNVIPFEISGITIGIYLVEIKTEQSLLARKLLVE